MRGAFTRLTLLGTMLLFAPTLSAEPNESALRAGAATADITPTKWPLPMVGSFDERLATKAWDPLHVRAIVLYDGKTKLAIAVVDSCYLPRNVLDDAKQRAANTTGIRADHMLISATHRTPRPRRDRREVKADPDYVELVTTGIVKAFEQANKNLEPAELGWGVAQVPEEVFNRRWYMKEGGIVANPFGQTNDAVRMNPPRGSDLLDRPAGPTDPDVSILSIRSATGRPIALLANYSLHYVGGIPAGGVSADYFGEFARLIEKKLGKDNGAQPPVVGIMSNGTSGDVNNINFRERGRSYKPLEKMREVAGRVADATLETYANIEHRRDVSLAMSQRLLTLNKRRPTPAQVERAQAFLAAEDDSSLPPRAKPYAQWTLQLNEPPHNAQLVLQAIRIGDVGITAIPCEVFTEIGLELKNKSPLKPTFTIELANGHYGYLPTPRQHALGGYETWLGTCILEIESSEKIKDVLFELLNEVAPDNETDSSAAAEATPVPVKGIVVDGETKQPLAARVYVRSTDGAFHHVQTASDQGNAVPYNKARSEQSVEIHTVVSAHPFKANLPPGEYEITIERGKEYRPQSASVQLSDEPVELKFELTRLIDMSKQGWYSGETHVHRSLDELPTAMLADDLNVALPLTYWVTKSDTPPGRGDKNSETVTAELIQVDSTHVIYPMNTEYEIFTVGEKRHTLGAIFALNHKNVLKMGTPPVAPIAEQVRAEGGLLELDKHNWPWSMMLVPVLNVDLYELTNNHNWRTEFHFGRFGEPAPKYMHIEMDENGMTEKGWIDFTFQNYYALLNCGFPMRPTAGTASGVHPVPLGYGRVFVYCPDGFSYGAWIAGLDEGRSFVTTGPLMNVSIDDQLPGHTFTVEGEATEFHIHGWVRSWQPLSRIEVVVNGEVAPIEVKNQKSADGSFESPIDLHIKVRDTMSSWIAVRCYEPTSRDRHRFAHAAPWHFHVAGKPVRPRRAEVQYFIERMQTEIQRSHGMLSEIAIDEYRAALATYEQIASDAR